MNKKDFYFPDAIEWMWKKPGRISLGKFKLEESKYDMGVCIDSTHPNYVSHAIVYDNEDGRYISGEIESSYRSDVCKENIKRFKDYIKLREEIKNEQ